ncbi:thiamine pyrophosphate protein [compost metagenome]
MAGIRVEDPAKLGDAWDYALSADRPAVIEVLTDPDIPLLPPFPAGAEKLEGMRSALAQEGAEGEHARQLLDIYAEGESRLRDSQGKQQP